MQPNFSMRSLVPKSMILIFLIFLAPNHLDAQVNYLYDNDSVIIIKGDKQFVPFEFINEKGEPDGFSVDLIRAMMKKLNIKYTLSLEDWDKVQNELYNKEIDMAVGMIYSDERASKVKFGIPHCMISYNIICRSDKDYLNISQLSGKKIAVQNHDRAHGYILESSLTNDIVAVEKISDAIKMLAERKCDAVLSFDFTAFYLVHKGNYKNLRVHMTDIPVEKYSMVVNTDNEDLLYLLNSALYQMKIDGEYDKIYYKWFGVYVQNKVYKIIWYILLGLFLVLIIASVFILLLNHRVKLATSDLRVKNEELNKENQLRKEIERNLILAKDKAEESDKLKTAFLKSMSHEIRTPLNAIIGFSSLMTEAAEKSQVAEYDSIIKSNSKILLDMVNDLLDLSIIESSVIRFTDSDFDLSELCHQTIAEAVACDNAGNIFKEDFMKECIMHSDRSRVHQIISHLLSNSIKFTNNGIITVGFHECPDDASMIYIYVKDTGVGIPEDKVNTIFDKFVKLDSFKQGTGIGLTVTSRIVDSMGGSIGVNSVYGEGTEVWLILPKVH